MDVDPISEMKGERIAASLVPVAAIKGDDDEDTHLLRQMADDAQQYITGFSWCEAILASYFGKGVGGIFAVFFFRIRPCAPDVDSWIWIMVGGIPSAYLPLADCDSPSEAYETYVAGMSRWVEFARKGQKGTADEGVPPINLPPNAEWAERLDQRIKTLKAVVGPFFEGDDWQETVEKTI